MVYFVLKGGRISFSGQVRNYQNTVSQLVNLLGDQNRTANYLSKCIFSIGLGSNDYLNNYFMTQFYSSSRQYTPEQWSDILIQQYTQQLRVSISFILHFFLNPNRQTPQKERKNLTLWCGFRICTTMEQGNLC